MQMPRMTTTSGSGSQESTANTSTSVHSRQNSQSTAPEDDNIAEVQSPGIDNPFKTEKLTPEEEIIIRAIAMPSAGIPRQVHTTTDITKHR